jgi:hypothetical protein
VVDWAAIATAEMQGLLPSSGDPVTAENETVMPPTPQAIRWQCFLGAIEGMASQQTSSVQQTSTASSGTSKSSKSSGSGNGTLIRDALKDAGFLHRTVEFVLQVRQYVTCNMLLSFYYFVDTHCLHVYVLLVVVQRWRYCHNERFEAMT